MNSNVNFWYLVDAEGFADDPKMLGVKRPVYVPINSPMTTLSDIRTEEQSATRLDDGTQTVYFDDIMQADFHSSKSIKTGGFNDDNYLSKVEEWKSKHYASNDPEFIAPENVEHLARALLNNGELNPQKFGIDFNKIYYATPCYYSGEEFSYYLVGYILNRYFYFPQVNFGQAFAMQYLNAAAYNLRTNAQISDAPWLIKAFNNGWAYAVSTSSNNPLGYAPPMYEEYSLESGFLADGLTVADMIDAALWIYAGGSVKKITVKVARNALASAYINWQVQILIRMICGMTYEDAVADVDYSAVAWQGLTNAINNDKTVMALDCVRAGVEEFENTKEITFDIARACLLDILQDIAIKKLISDKNSPYGKFLYNKLMTKNGSKKAFMQQLTIVFNCTSEQAMEIMRFIPAEIIDSMIDDLK
jgi:hypothetical protein